MASNHKTTVIGAVAALIVLASTIAIAAPEKPLTVVSWGGSYTRSQMLAYVKPYREQNNEWVQMETYNG
ncbi:MAG: ABC transporter substrate-binding protein, partial [Gammaproteobacteria bacterium]|nr:ABC transporter substrate-binding protein [Gammaproteobacteria bacterium]